jgi:hypothetical protein
MSSYNHNDPIKQPEAITLPKRWYTIDEAATMFCLTIAQIDNWVKYNLVHFVQDNSRAILIKGEDIERRLYHFCN